MYCSARGCVLNLQFGLCWKSSVPDNKSPQSGPEAGGHVPPKRIILQHKKPGALPPVHRWRVVVGLFQGNALLGSVLLVNNLFGLQRHVRSFRAWLLSRTERPSDRTFGLQSLSALVR